MALTFEDKIDPSRAALIVVDAQNYYCHADGPAKWEDHSTCTAAVANIQRLIEGARRAGVPVVYLRNWHEDCTDSEAWATRGGRSAIGLRSSTWEADWYEVAPAPGEAVVNKHRYSGFAGTRLDAILHTYGRSSVIVTGVATNVASRAPRVTPCSTTTTWCSCRTPRPRGTAACCTKPRWTTCGCTSGSSPRRGKCSVAGSGWQ